MEVQRIIELMETIADYRGQLSKYRAYVKEHPSCRFAWESKISNMEKILSQMEHKFQMVSFDL